MVTLQDMIEELEKIENAADSIEVRGKNNAALLCYICSKCEEMIKELSETAREIQNGSPEIVTAPKDGEENGESNTGSA